MDPDKGMYYEGICYKSNPVAARIWSLLDTARAVAEVGDVLIGEYDAPPDVCRRDFLAWLTKANEPGTMEVRGTRDTVISSSNSPRYRTRIMDKAQPVTDKTKPVTNSRQNSSPVRRTVQQRGQKLPWRRPSLRKLAAAERTQSGAYPYQALENPYNMPAS